MPKWKWLLPVLLLLALAVWRGQVLLEDKTPVSSSIQSVQTELVQEIEKKQTMLFNGTVTAGQTAIIGAEINARVREVLVQNGDAVVKGQTLVLLDSRNYETAYQLAEANLQKARSALSLAQSSISKLQVLYEQAAVSHQVYEEAQANFKIAAAEEKAALSGYEQAQRALQNTTITSPMDGQIFACTVLAEQMAAPGVPLMMIADTERVKIVFNIPQQEVNYISNHDLTAQVRAEGLTGEFEGQHISISPVANPAARSFEATLRVDNHDHLLKPGMFVQISLDTGQIEKILTVPANAILDVAGEYYVFVAEEGQARKRQVKTGESIGDRVEILSGLNTGEQIIVTKVNHLQDGDSINIQP